MDPTALINIGGGLLGGILGKRTNPYEQAAAEQMRKQNALSDIIRQMAQGYDPAQETTASVDFAQKRSERTLQNALAGLNQRFKAQGGSPTGDTNFGYAQQRTADDVLNPLAVFAAERKAGEFARRLAAMQAAMGTGQMAFGNAMGMMNSYQPQDYGGSQMQLAQGIQGLLPQQKTPSRKVAENRFGTLDGNDQQWGR